MRTTHLYALSFPIFMSQPVLAQVEMHVVHAFPGVCDGVIYTLQADSVHWSTGEVGNSMNAGPGIYSYTAYVAGEAITGEREIENNGWDVEMQAWPSWNGLMLSGHVAIHYCMTSNFNIPCCIPETESTHLELLQDGEPYTPELCIGCTEIWCAAGTFMIQGLPYGHAYQVVLVDPTCAGTVMEPAGMAIAHSCSNLEVVTEVVDPTEGAADGSVHFVEAIPDPNEPYPISAPVIGTATLRDAATMELIDLFEQVGSATWEGLAAGEYLLTFNADEGCQAYADTLTVGSINTGASVLSAPNGLRLFPAITDDLLYITSQGYDPVRLNIHDLHGRSVLQRSSVQSTVGVGGLAAGTYIATLEQGDHRHRARFIKR